MAESGYSLTDDLFSHLEIEALHALFESGHSKNLFLPAKISGQTRKLVEQSIRGDFTHWLSEADFITPCLSLYENFFLALTLALNRTLFLGIHHHDFHFSFYPSGTFYETHLDQPRHGSNRKITFIHYLNPHWSQDDGGELRLYLNDDQSRYVDVQPVWGRSLFFVSDRFYHEVRPVLSGVRKSMSGWFSG